MARTTTELPEGSKFRPASGGGIGARSADYISPSGVRYVQQGTKKITETITRPQRAGDAEYDKLAASLSRLQTRHKYRFAPQYSQDGGTGLTSENIYQKLGMAKDGGLKEDLKNKKFSNGGKASIRGTKFTGVF